MNSRTKAILILCGLALVALIVIPLFSSNSPKEWLDSHYTNVSGADPKKETVVYSSDEDVDQTVNAIIAGTDPDDTNQQTVPVDSPEATTDDVPEGPAAPGAATTEGTVEGPAAPGAMPDAPTDGDSDVPAGSTETVVLLRYGSDWIVTVSPDRDLGNAGGSRVELDEFDRGYDRHSGIFFLGMWNSHYKSGGLGSSFRGGGSGFGK